MGIADIILSAGKGVTPVQSPIEWMNNAEILRGNQTQNQLLQRKMQSEDAASQKINKLSGLRASALKDGKTDYQALIQGLASEGMGSEIPAVQQEQIDLSKEDRLKAKDDIETTMNRIKTTRDVVMSGNEQNWDSEILPVLNQIYQGNVPEHLRTHNPQAIKSALDQSVSFEEKLKHEWQLNELAIKSQENQLNRDVTMRGQDITVRGQDINAGNEPLVQTVGPNGLPVYTPRSKAIGMPAYSETGISNKPMTEAQSKATTFVSQMQSASNVLDTLEAEGYDPSKLSTQASNILSGGSTNVLAPKLSQKANQAQNQWAESFLRVKTGAAATKDEIKLNVETFFPQFGDSKEVVAQKDAARAQAERDVLNMSGSGRGLVTKRTEASPKNDWTSHPAYADYLKEIGGQ